MLLLFPSSLNIHTIFASLRSPLVLYSLLHDNLSAHIFHIPCMILLFPLYTIPTPTGMPYLGCSLHSTPTLSVIRHMPDFSFTLLAALLMTWPYVPFLLLQLSLAFVTVPFVALPYALLSLLLPFLQWTLFTLVSLLSTFKTLYFYYLLPSASLLPSLLPYTTLLYYLTS